MGLIATEFSYAVTKIYFNDAAAMVRAEVPAQSERFGLPLHLRQWEYDISFVDRFLQQRVQDMENRIAVFFSLGENTLAFNDLYPNPVVDDIHLLVWSDGLAVELVSVFDVMGRQILTAKVILKMGENEVRLPCPFASGVYFLRIRNQIKRFVIQ